MGSRTAALLALALAGCPDRGSGEAAPSGTPFVAIQPEDARLVMAAQELKARFGHEVNLDVDAQLLKAHAAQLTPMIADALETIARGIDRARAERPAVALALLARVGTLKIELDEKAREPRVWVDGAGGVLLVSVPSGAASFATDESVAAAFVATE